jgi:hypothetical protein
MDYCSVYGGSRQGAIEFMEFVAMLAMQLIRYEKDQSSRRLRRRTNEADAMEQESHKVSYIYKITFCL